MKLLHCLCSSFYPLQLLANFVRCRCTLSTFTKKPASLAGFSYLRLCLTSLTTLFLLPPYFPATQRSSQLSIQTPNCPNPA
jgi:hypothetical protein